MDVTAAVRAANAYLVAVGQTGTVAVVGNTVTVRIEEVEPTVMLGIVGIHRIGISASASATSVHGVTRQD